MKSANCKMKIDIGQGAHAMMKSVALAVCQTSPLSRKRARGTISRCVLRAGAALFLVAMGTAGSGAADTPQGLDNLARGKRYTMEPSPNYKYCTDEGDKTQLTDGVYTKGYFWTQKSTVGWSHARHVIITIDLGTVQPIRGRLVQYGRRRGGRHLARLHPHFGQRRRQDLFFRRRPRRA